MAIKTFNPNRTVGGTFSLVRAADGTYSVKENGFESLGALQLPDLSATAVTPDTPDTPETPDTPTVEDQTKQAFELPKPGDDKTQADKDADIFQRATDLSSNLSNLETVSDRQKQESQQHMIFNCFLTIAQISELVFSANDKHGSFFFCGFISSAYVIACSIGLFPVCFFTP